MFFPTAPYLHHDKKLCGDIFHLDFYINVNCPFVCMVASTAENADSRKRGEYDYFIVPAKHSKLGWIV